MPEETSTTTAETTETSATTEAAATGTETTQTDDTSTIAEIAAMASELGITPGQLKGRLEASRKWEDRAKKADEAAEAARVAALSEQDKAIEKAREEGKAEAQTGFAVVLAAAELKAALASVGVEDPADVVADLDLSKFLDTDGGLDAVKVAALKARHGSKKTAVSGSADGGPLGTTTTGIKQLSRADLKGMTPEQISEARASGQLAGLFSGST